MRLYLWFVAVVGTMFIVSPVAAVPLASTSFNHQYNGDIYPALTGPGTSFTENAGDGSVWSPSTDGDILSFQNTVANGLGFFRNDEWNSSVNDAVGWTIEWRVKIGTDADDDPIGGAFNVFAKEPNNHATTNNASNDTTRRTAVNIGQDFVSLSSFSNTPIDTNDNTDDFHVFRVAQAAGSSDVTIWRDGIQIYSGISKTSNNSGVDLYFGDGGTGLGGPTIELDYFRWDDTGPYEPIPEPSTSFLFGLGGISLIGWRRHRRG